VRVPVSDLEDDLQGTRLQLLRDEGVAVIGVWLWSERLALSESVGTFADQVDAAELQVPGELFPDNDVLQRLVQCREKYGKPVVLTPIISREATEGKYHPRTRFGYRAGELRDLAHHLEKSNVEIDRVVCHIDPDDPPWNEIRALGELQLDHVDELDYVVRLPGTDEDVHLRYVAEALLTMTLQPGNRLFFAPFVDLDRTNDLNNGLLDRLSNPRPAYDVMQCMNTLLFGQNERYMPIQADGNECTLGIESASHRHWLVMPGGEGLDLDGEFSVVDLVQGWRKTESGDALKQLLSGADTPHLVTEVIR